MQVKYGFKNTYSHHIDKDLLNMLTDITNRSNQQTLFLYQLVDGNFSKLTELEKRLRDNGVFICPDTKETVNQILSI